MRIHTLQHVAFEDAANIGAWAIDRGHTLAATRLFDGEPLPSLSSFDWLVIMGGPMNVYEQDAYPWLAPEKRFLETAIHRGKFVLGVCLGAQLAADVLGGRVTQNRHREIGWFPISLTEEGDVSFLFEGFPKRFVAFHWHGDAFSIPPGARRLAESEACANQAFRYANHVVALQFHLDYSVDSIEKMLQHGRRELDAGSYVQSAETIRASYHQVGTTRTLLSRLLDNLQTRWSAERRD